MNNGRKTRNRPSQANRGMRPVEHKRQIRPSENYYGRGDAERSSNIRQRPKRRSPLPIILLLVAVIITVLVLVFVAFRVNNVKFNPGKNSKADKNQVIAAANIEMNSSYFSVDAVKIKNNIETAFPDIGEIKVEKKAPSTVVITDAGYENLINLKYGGKYIVLDKNNIVTRILKKPLKSTSVIEGVELNSCVLNKKAEFNGEDTEERINSVRSAVRETKIQNISTMKFESDGNVILNYDKRIKLILGNVSNINDKLERAKAIVADENNLKAKGTLDLSINGNAYFKSE